VLAPGGEETDKALERLLANMREERLLENTLVVVTSATSGAPLEKVNLPSGQLAANHGILFMQLPDGTKGRAEEYFSQADFALSISDYLGLPQPRYPGRSFFRAYENARSVAFANPYLNRIYTFDGGALLRICDRWLNGCQRLVNKQPREGLFGGHFVLERAKKADMAEARTVVVLNDAPPPPEQPGPAPQKNPPPRGKLIYGRKNIAIKKDEVLTWEGRFALQGPATSAVFWFEIFNQHTQELVSRKNLTVRKGEPQHLSISFTAQSPMTLYVRGRVDSRQGTNVRVTQKRLHISKEKN
jgi:hypothetical protein